MLVKTYFFTEMKLQNMYRHFGHPHVCKIENVFKQETVKRTLEKTVKILKEINENCHEYRRFVLKPKSFKFTRRDNYILLNRAINCDILTISKVPVMHVVDEFTWFQTSHKAR